MRKFLDVLLVAFVIIFNPLPAAAAIIDLPSDSSAGYFQDTRTGYIWWDLDNTYNMYYDLNLALENAEGFHIATQEELKSLEHTLNNTTITDPFVFFNRSEGFDASGGNIMSFYNDGDSSDGISWVGGSIFGGTWQYRPVYELPDKDSVSPEQWQEAVEIQRKFSLDGVGMMIVDTRQSIISPEPASASLLVMGLGGIIFRRLRNRADCLVW